MTITTIKIKSDPTDDNPLGFIIINLSDFDSAKHEPFDDEARIALSGAVASGEVVPSVAELLAARDSLLAREREVAAAEERNAEQARANEAEAQRLRDEAAALAAPKKPGIADLRDALTAKGIPFAPDATKAELQALLDAAGG